MKTLLDDMPLDVKEMLIGLTEKLPKHNRASFLRNTLQRIEQLSYKYPNTLLYSVMGWVIGEILDNILTVHLPFAKEAVALSGNKLSSIGFIYGLINGFFEDKTVNQQRESIRQIVIEEVQRALKNKNR